MQLVNLRTGVVAMQWFYKVGARNGNKAPPTHGQEPSSKMDAREKKLMKVKRFVMNRK